MHYQSLKEVSSVCFLTRQKFFAIMPLILQKILLEINKPGLQRRTFNHILAEEQYILSELS